MTLKPGWDQLTNTRRADSELLIGEDVAEHQHHTQALTSPAVKWGCRGLDEVSEPVTVEEHEVNGRVHGDLVRETLGH